MTHDEAIEADTMEERLRGRFETRLNADFSCTVWLDGELFDEWDTENQALDSINNWIKVFTQVATTEVVRAKAEMLDKIRAERAKCQLWNERLAMEVIDGVLELLEGS